MTAYLRCTWLFSPSKSSRVVLVLHSYAWRLHDDWPFLSVRKWVRVWSHVSSQDAFASIYFPWGISPCLASRLSIGGAGLGTHGKDCDIEHVWVYWECDQRRIKGGPARLSYSAIASMWSCALEVWSVSLAMTSPAILFPNRCTLVACHL